MACKRFLLMGKFIDHLIQDVVGQSTGTFNTIFTKVEGDNRKTAPLARQGQTRRINNNSIPSSANKGFYTLCPIVNPTSCCFAWQCTLCIRSTTVLDVESPRQWSRRWMVELVPQRPVAGSQGPVSPL
jgi:hypothetical protein